MKRSGGSKQTASASKAAERLQQQHSTADASASAFGTYGGFGGYRGAHKIATQTAAAAASSPTSSAEKRSRGEGQGTDGWMFVFVCLFACLFACLLVRDSEFRRVVKPIRRLAGWLAAWTGTSLSGSVDSAAAENDEREEGESEADACAEI